MEGQQCSMAGCQVTDFLPFMCNKCELWYCLEHRSRFAHTCVVSSDATINVKSSASASNNQQTVKSIFQDVENRFKGGEVASTKEHGFKVNTSSMPKNMQYSPDFVDRMNRLDKITEKSSSSEKQKSISNKTKQMLIKARAVGNNNVATTDRHHLVVQFVDDNHHEKGGKFYIFTKNSLTLGEALHYIEQNYHNQILNITKQIKSSSGEDTLVLTTSDTQEWNQWDRTAVISEALADFEEVLIHYEKSKEVVINQSSINYRRDALRRLVTEASGSGGVADHLDPKASVSNRDGHTSTHTQEAASARKVIFAKSDLAWYRVTRDYSDKDMLVVIVGVHYDGMGLEAHNIFYTIQPADPRSSSASAAASSSYVSSAYTSAASYSSSSSSSLSDTFAPPWEEKQTDCNRLFTLAEKQGSGGTNQPTAQEASLTGGINPPVNNQPEPENIGVVNTVSVSFLKQDFPGVSIGSGNTVLQLKTKISMLTRLAPRDMKLICKGSVLKPDSTLISATKVISGVKIMVMESKLRINSHG